MAISAVPYALQNGSHSADLFRQATSSLVPPAGGLVTSGDFAVTQTGTPSMNVLIGVGRAWVPGTNVGNVTGGNFSKQAMYFALNDAAFTASVDTSDPINPRIDVVYLAIQDSQYAGTANAAVLAVAKGAPTSGATYPANAPVLPANAIALAWINVAANAASIVNANISPVAAQIVKPRVIPSAGRIGSTAALPTAFANGSISPIIQGGSVSATTDASGYYAITFPIPFPNGIITTVFTNGDAAASGRAKIVSIATTPFTNTLSTVYVSVVNGDGTPHASAPFRCEYIAMGW